MGTFGFGVFGGRVTSRGGLIKFGDCEKLKSQFTRCLQETRRKSASYVSWSDFLSQSLAELQPNSVQKPIQWLPRSLKARICISNFDVTKCQDEVSTAEKSNVCCLATIITPIAIKHLEYNLARQSGLQNLKIVIDLTDVRNISHMVRATACFVKHESNSNSFLRWYATAKVLYHDLRFKLERGTKWNVKAKQGLYQKQKLTLYDQL